MLYLTGRIIKKGVIKEGLGINGTWRIMRFWIERQYNHKKINVIFTAKGRVSDFIYRLPLNEKIEVEFFPDCVVFPNANGDEKVFTELIAVHVEIVKTKAEQYFENNIVVPNGEIPFGDDFKMLKKNKYNGKKVSKKQD